MTGTLRVSAPAKESRLRAVVTRADGTREDYGLISYYDRNPLKRLAWQCYRMPRDAWRRLRAALGLRAVVPRIIPPEEQ